jgi:hypothetical protein
MTKIVNGSLEPFLCLMRLIAVRLMVSYLEKIAHQKE